MSTDPQAPQDLAAAIERTAADYDAAPYQSHAFALTQPTRLAAIARMFGLDAPVVSTARVLELGCAAGGNLLPLAYRFPNARFVGVDVSSVQIAYARRRCDQLGLTNVELRQASITGIGEGGTGDDPGTFDYIICHGVYSWVPAPVREAILRVCGERLAGNGIALVSYNVRPGWHLKHVLRDAMVAHAGQIADPAQRLSAAKAFVAFLAERVEAATPYGRVLCSEAAFLAGQDDDYVLHDLLETDNTPCTVTEFVQAAERHGVTYLAESEIETMLPENYGTDVARSLRHLSDDRLLGLEQNIDILSGRTFRQTLLVKPGHARRATRRLEPARMADLHCSGTFQQSHETTSAGPFVFSDAHGRTVTTSSTMVAAALAMLGTRYPGTAQPRELLDLVSSSARGARTGTENTEVAEILDALFRMTIIGMIGVSSDRVRVGTAAIERPVGFGPARVDAANGAVHGANLRHEMVAIDAVMQTLLPFLDGSRTRSELADASGLAAADVAAALERLASGALIEPAD